MEIDLTVPGKPVAQPRPRVTRWGSYDPAKKRKDKFRVIAQEQIDSALGGALHASLTFYMPIPKATSKAKRKLLLENGAKHTKLTGDLDNLIKFVFDALNGIAYKDDSQIWSLSASKVYSEEPRTEIILQSQWENSL